MLFTLCFHTVKNKEKKCKPKKLKTFCMATITLTCWSTAHCDCSWTSRRWAVFLRAPAPESTEPRDKGLRKKEKEQKKEKKENAALTCTSADSEGSQHVCLFPSTLNSPLTPFKKLICLGHLRKPRQTFAEDFRLSRLFLSLIIFPSFHTRVRWAPMKEPNSWSTGQSFKKKKKKNTTMEALASVP